MLTNNSILRRVRYALDFKDSEMMNLFELSNCTTNINLIRNWLKKEGDPQLEEIDDNHLAGFLNGIIVLKRGKKEGVELVNEENLNNNIIFRKLKIALNLKVEDIVEILKLVDFKVSKHEITAIFRNPKQRQYRECQDQFLRNFLQGLTMKNREKK